jgi:hypothetical protein
MKARRGGVKATAKRGVNQRKRQLKRMAWRKRHNGGGEMACGVISAAKAWQRNHRHRKWRNRKCIINGGEMKSRSAKIEGERKKM